ncbi:PPOX class F420-dependent oxidoreductase [Mycolicibacterium sp. 624]|uniref:PPOX class F420-dependent oxidoreductase n=1 Tax=Mycolicibacterium sp. 624 TaxID=3156314 RepID=UPI00339A5018
MNTIPGGYETLLGRPLYAHLATVRPDGTVQVSPMWFEWDGEVLRLNTRPQQQRYRNMKAHPQVALSIIDPDNPFRYLEVRGIVEEFIPDPTGEHYMRLNAVYDGPRTEPPRDRVTFIVRPTFFSTIAVQRQRCARAHGPMRTEPIAESLICG